MCEKSAAANNIALVRACIKRFCGKGIEYDDLFQAGCEGLVKAAERFKTERGCCFSTYAVPVIIGEVRRLFRDGGSVHVSRGLRELGMKLERTRELLRAQSGREPTISELSESLGVSAEQASEALCAAAAPVSLSIMTDDGMCETDIPTEAPEGAITEILSLRQELARLDSADRKLLYLRYFCGMTQSSAARELSMTQVQVSRREKKLLSVLRERLVL